MEAGHEIEAWLKRSLEVRVESWAADKLEGKCWKKGAPRDAGLMFMWAAVWMPREIGVRRMKIEDVLRKSEKRPGQVGGHMVTYPKV